MTASSARGVRRAALVLAILPWGAAAGQGRITVGPAVQVSADRDGREHWEVILDAHPADPTMLVACSMMFHADANEMRTVTYRTRDGGRSWQAILEEDGGRQSADPECEYGAEGELYVASLYAADPPRTDWTMMVHRSTDGGSTWDGRVVLPFRDREYVTVDRTGGRFHGRVYLHGVGRLRTVERADGHRASITTLSVFHSTDGARSFDGPRDLPSLGGRWLGPTSNGVVLPDGTLAILFNVALDTGRADTSRARPNWSVYLTTSRDGGETFTQAQVVRAPETACRFGASAMPMLAADHSSGPFRGRLYAVWPAMHGGRCRIALARSDDAGATWTTPDWIADADGWTMPAPSSDQLMPTVAVNRHGVVGVLWYDRRGDTANVSFVPRFAASHDGGESFSPSVGLSTHANAPSWQRPLSLHVWPSAGADRVTISAHSAFRFDGGDTGGLAAAADGRFHALWIDNRTGIGQVWTAAVTVEGNASRHGDPALDDRVDVSAGTRLLVRRTSYEPRSGVVSMDVILLNVGPDTIRPPLSLRALRMDSGYGLITAAGSDNDRAGPGASWEWTSLVSRSGLAPGDSSRARRITFRLDTRAPLRPLDGIPRPTWFSVDMRVLAGRR